MKKPRTKPLADGTGLAMQAVRLHSKGTGMSHFQLKGKRVLINGEAIPVGGGALGSIYY